MDFSRFFIISPLSGLEAIYSFLNRWAAPIAEVFRPFRASDENSGFLSMAASIAEVFRPLRREMLKELI